MSPETNWEIKMLGKATSLLIKTTLTISAIMFIAGKADAKSGPFMETGKLTSIPIGHYQFCNQNPDECRLTTRGDVRVQLTQDNWQTLLDINYHANHSIQSITDLDLYGKEEVWAYPSYAGDCEDYVLIKRRGLIAAGWPPASLLITVVLQPNGEGHAVLTVRTDRGDLILDNLQERVMVWNETPYTYLKRQSKNHTGKWETINDQPVSSVGSITQ